MTKPDALRSFLEGEVEALQAFDFVAMSPVGKPFHMLEVTRLEEGGLEVRVPGRPPVVPELPVPVRSALHERGFKNTDPADPTKPWIHAAEDAASAVDLTLRLFAEVFEEKPDLTLDIAHGSHRAEHEAEQKLSVVREQIERVVAAVAERPPERDADGDYVLPVADVHVTVAPRAVPHGPVVVRVFAITNVGVTVGAELGLLLARLNFGLMFGRFALDAEHRSVWFDEALLGDHLTDEELRFAIQVVASTADQWDDRLKQMFGGATHQEVLAQGNQKLEPPPVKPGQGGYL